MKKAAIGDARRHLGEKADYWPVKVLRAEFDGIPSLGSGSVELGTPIVVLSGINGVGKTTLLLAIWRALSGAVGPNPDTIAKKLSAGHLMVETWTVSGAGDGLVTFRSEDELDIAVTHDIAANYIDTSFYAVRAQHYFCKYDDVDDIKNGQPERELPPKSLVEVSHLACRSYTRVNVTEVEFFEEIIPFFEIAFGDVTYDSRTMGLGEYSALYLWWSLDRAASGEVFCIEEPEAFMSLLSQKAFADYLTVVTDQKKLCIICTSHSGPIISGVPVQCVRWLWRDAGGMRVRAGEPTPVLLDGLGIEIRTDVFLFVEDEAAKSFTRMLLSRFAPVAERRVRIQNVAGEANITRGLLEMRDRFGPAIFVGLYDGDQRGKVAEEILYLSAFLPGDVPIEAMFKSAIEANAAALAVRFPGLPEILSAIQGMEIHNWYHELATSLGLTRSQLLAVLFDFWLAQPGNEDLAEATVSEIKALMPQAD